MRKRLMILLMFPFHAMAAGFTCEAVYSNHDDSRYLEESIQASSLGKSAQICIQRVMDEMKTDHLEVFLAPQNKASCTLVLEGSYEGYSLMEQISPWKNAADAKKFTYQSNLQTCLDQTLSQIEQGYTYARRYGRVKSSFPVDIDLVYFSAKLYSENNNQHPAFLTLTVQVD